MDDRVKFGVLGYTVADLLDSLPAAPVLRTFVQYLIALCSRLEAACDVISGSLWADCP